VDVTSVGRRDSDVASVVTAPLRQILSHIAQPKPDDSEPGIIAESS
jgi:hypothetical protein